MDPNRGTLYPSREAAVLAGVLDAVEVVGRPEDVERISAAVGRQWTREQKAKRNSANKAARKSRRTNRH